MDITSDAAPAPVPIPALPRPCKQPTLDSQGTCTSDPRPTRRRSAGHRGGSCSRPGGSSGQTPLKFRPKNRRKHLFGHPSSRSQIPLKFRPKNRWKHLSRHPSSRPFPPPPRAGWPGASMTQKKAKSAQQNAIDFHALSSTHLHRIRSKNTNYTTRLGQPCRERSTPLWPSPYYSSTTKAGILFVHVD